MCQYKTSNYSTFQAIPTFNPTKLVFVHSTLGLPNSNQVPQTEFESGTSNRSDGSVHPDELTFRISVVDPEICGLIRSGSGIIFFGLGFVSGSGTVFNLLTRTNSEIRKFYSLIIKLLSLQSQVHTVVPYLEVLLYPIYVYFFHIPPSFLLVLV